MHSSSVPSTSTAEPVAAIRVVVCWSPGPREVRERALELPEGATLRQAVKASGLFEVEPELLMPQGAGIWGRKAEWDAVLREGDRVEVYRPLTVDPKVARRERFRKQGTRAAGLFSARRPGAKPGY
ncbi:RnfH family protein [Ramlibacter sp.]|uniref:RnfH family protein n=1 Tax=Ramlibacter sp. TaxID=1917967 RepID=UPI003D10F885